MSVPVAWVVGLMVALEPSAPWRGTYEKTAEAIARVSESDPLFEDKGEERTATLLVALAWYESRFKANVKSSNNQWYCLFQIDKRHLPDPQKALDDPEVCTRAAVKILKASFEMCKRSKPEDRLAAFVSGACDKGLPESRYRMFLANKLLKEHPMPVPAGGASSARAR
jgi:hypothetical protein